MGRSTTRRWRFRGPALQLQQRLAVRSGRCQHAPRLQLGFRRLAFLAHFLDEEVLRDERRGDLMQLAAVRGKRHSAVNSGFQRGANPAIGQPIGWWIVLVYQGLQLFLISTAGNDPLPYTERGTD